MNFLLKMRDLRETRKKKRKKRVLKRKRPTA
jgi:hypothetical protein